MAALIENRLANLDRALDDRPQQDLLLVKLDIAACDVGDIEHVVHQLHHGLALPMYDRGGKGLPFFSRRFRREQACRRDERRKRVAQLVAKHGQKFILSPVGQCELLGPLAKVRAAHAALGAVALG